MPEIDDELLAPSAGTSPDVHAAPVAGPEQAPAPAMDGAGIVRVWLTDGRLTGVRVSHTWRNRIGRRSLESCFAEALALAALRDEVLPFAEDGTLGESPAVAEPQDYDGIDFGQLPRFDSRTFQGIRDRFDDVEQRWDDALQQQHADRVVAHPVTGTHKGATVTLDGDGRPEQVAFDKKWLADAQAEAIGSHVLRAADAAVARFVPDDRGREEVDACEAEHQFLMAAFTAMLNPEEE